MLRPMLKEQRRPAVLFSNLFDDFFDDFFSRIEGGSTDVLDKGDHYLLQAELPGFKKEDISMKLENDMMIIKASHQDETKEEKDNYIRRERNLNSYQRTFSVAGVDKDRIMASYNNGILAVTLPKEDALTDGNKSIEIQ
ncbi:Hsp20/alpha crystallin family protein [Anaerocolumna jejuensis]|uniref:Hsp20/alpha crystallin family protein n=1 Tax=Anaerocolumna jejuensis TaxID=259063 RepID=UPI003F7BC424